MADAEERLIQWLRDAHAMEKQADKMLTSLATRIEHYPDLKAKIEEHIQQTRSQARRLEECIQRRGGDTSKLKDVAGQMMAMGQSFAGMFAGDEVVKGALAGYTFEHMEIASYRILIAAAEAVEDQETAAVCEEILAEEEEMASWLAENMGFVTREYLTRDERELEEAKR